MRKIVVAVMSTISGLVLLFSYHTSTNSQAAAGGSDAGTEPQTGSGTTSNGSATASPSASAGPSTGSTPSATASPSATAGSSSAGSSVSGTFTGEVAQTRWGPVQVQITVKDGVITKAEALEYPTENPKDQQINAYAIPALNQQVLQAQSGNIDAVSGATVTSDGYLESLQSALDQAHLS